MEIRNSILLQNFWLINYLADKIISRNDLPENLKPDMLGDGTVHFLEVLDDVVRNNRPEFFSRKMYKLLQNHLLKIYVREYESLELPGDLDYLSGAEDNLTKEMDLEDFWTDLNEIKKCSCLVKKNRKIMVFTYQIFRGYPNGGTWIDNRII